MRCGWPRGACRAWRGRWRGSSPASAAARRRALADEALELARRAADPGTLAEVLDGRLHALWDPAGAEDRLAAGSEIIDLAQAAGDDRRERHGLFWRFVALMELGRVAEAESALVAFAREAAAAGDAEAAVMVTARHAMLAILHGRFDQASQLVGEVAERARRVGLAAADRQPGHLFEATAARILVLLGRSAEAGAELATAVRRAAAGQRTVDPGLAAAALAEGTNPLSGREREVLAAARHGGTAADIAVRLHLSEGTVRNHLSTAIRKLGARSRLEALNIAAQKGWL